MSDESRTARPGQGSQALQDEGRKLLGALYGALRALKFYPLENDVVQQALDEVHGITGAILAREGLVELKVMGDFFFLNDSRLRLDLRNFSTFGSFARALREHRIGQVVVDRGFSCRSGLRSCCSFSDPPTPTNPTRRSRRSCPRRP